MSAIIRGASAAPISKWESMQAAAEKQPANDTTAAPQGKRDVCEISRDWESQVDWEQQLKEYLSNLEKTYQNVEISIGDVEDLERFAADLGKGAHVVLSTAFLKKMVSGAESFYKGKELLTSIVKQLSYGVLSTAQGAGAYVDEGGVTFWSVHEEEKKEEKNPWELDTGYKTLFDTMEELRKRAEANKEKYALKISKSTLNSPVTTSARLASAVDVSGVRQAMSTAQRNISSLKLALALGPDKDKGKIRAVIAALEKIIIRGSRKIHELNNEDDLRFRQKKAEREQQQRRALLLKEELQQRQTKRRLRENGEMKQERLRYYSQDDERWRLQGLQDAIAGDVAGGVIEGGFDMSGAGAEGAGAAMEVTVSPTIEISI